MHINLNSNVVFFVIFVCWFFRFRLTAAGPQQCKECLEDDEGTCIQRQDPQSCATDIRSLGTTHCVTAKVKYRDSFRAGDGIFRGCIDCAGK